MSDAPLNGEAPEENGKPPVSPIEWHKLVAEIKSSDKGINEAATEQLYKLLNRGIRYYLCRQLGPRELDDKVHDTFLIVLQAIKRGDLRERERLMEFVRTVVRRQVAGEIFT